MYNLDILSIGISVLKTASHKDVSMRGQFTSGQKSPVHVDKRLGRAQSHLYVVTMKNFVSLSGTDPRH